MNKLRIIIEGEAKTGKSVFAQAIRNIYGQDGILYARSAEESLGEIWPTRD